MTPELEKFIALATRPLEGEQAMRDDARGELMGRLSHQGVPVEELDVSGPTHRLEEAVSMPNQWRRGWLLGSLILLIVFFLIGLWRDGSMLFRSIYADELSWRDASIHTKTMSRWDEFFYDWLSDRSPDMPLTGRFGELEHLRERHPEDLVILQEALLQRSIDEDEFMTAQERALVERLDGDNSLWPLLEYRWALHKAVGVESTNFFYSGSAGVSDKEAEKLAWKRHSDAMRLERFESYGSRLVRAQTEAYGDESTVFDGMIREGLVGVPFSSGSLRFNVYKGSGDVMSDAIVGRVTELAAADDPEPLVDFYEEWKQRCRHVLTPEYPDSWTVTNLVGDPAPVFDVFAVRFAALGLTDLEEEALGAFGSLQTSPPTLSYTNSGEQGIRLQSAWGWVPELAPEEVTPGRNADMAMLHRMLLWPLVGVAVIFVGLCGFEACRRAPEVKGLARGLMPLLTRRDQLVIGVWGILVPWLYWWTITRLTPMGIPDEFFGSDEWLAISWVLQIALGFVLGLVMLTQTVQARWHRVGGFLGLGGAAPWLGRMVIWVVAAAIPVTGLIQYVPDVGDDPKGYFLMACSCVGACGLLWLLWVGIMNLCTPRHGSLRPAIVGRTLLPWSLAGLATLLLAAGVLSFAEGYWYRRDPLLPGWTSEHYVNALEERKITQQVTSLREIFNP